MIVKLHFLQATPKSPNEGTFYNAQKLTLLIVIHIETHPQIIMVCIFLLKMINPQPPTLFNYGVFVVVLGHWAATLTLCLLILS